ncbi:MAG: thiamine phosphate synthase [Muribaculaceae bacterium]|nr:thiamine phosphate synthase [Muribaculaceae bacterium]
MLQILITPNDKYSISEMCQMAIEAGATWIVLSVGDGEGIRDDIRDITEMCRAGGIILTCDNVALAREYSMHGVLVEGHSASPVSLRQELGAEAIIGSLSESGTPDAIMALDRADIDYVALSDTGSTSSAVISDVRSAGCNIPVVAYVPDMPLSIEDAGVLIDKGFSGICAGARFFDNDNPVKSIEELLRHLA